MPEAQTQVKAMHSKEDRSGAVTPSTELPEYPFAFLTFKKQDYAVLKKPPARSPTVSADITVFLCGIAHLRAKMAF